MADDDFPVTLEASPAEEATQESPAEQTTEDVGGRDQKIDELTKQVNDLKSQRGGQVSAQRRQDEILSALDTLRLEHGTEIGSLRRTVATLLDNYTKNGDPADLAEAVSTIQSETENEASEQRFDASYRKASALMKQSLAGTGLDPAGEELAEVRAMWQQGRTAKDSVSLFEAAAMANTVALQAFRTQATGQTSSKNPDLDMAIPRNGSGAEVSDQELYNRYGRGEVNRTKVVIDAAKRLGLPI